MKFGPNVENKSADTVVVSVGNLCSIARHPDSTSITGQRFGKTVNIHRYIAILTRCLPVAMGLTR